VTEHSLSSQIIAVLENDPECSFNSKGIYNVLFYQRNKPTDKKKLAKIRTELKRLSDRNKIRRETRGYYQAKPTPKIIKKLEDPETKLHGIKLECELAENNTFGIPPISAHSNISDFLKTNRFDEVTTRKGTFLKRWTRNIWWEDRDITITVHTMGLIEIFCSASKKPMVFPEFVAFCNFLSGYLQPISPFKKRNVVMTQIGVGRDFETQQMEGVTCITLHKFMNDWARIYQKEDGRVRYEHHLKLNITLEDAFNSLQLLTQAPQTNGFVKIKDEGVDVT